MKKIFIVIAILALGGCSCVCPRQPIRVVSNESNTKIYLNDEYQGTDSTHVFIPNKGVSTALLKGDKKGCHIQEMPVEHLFDYGVLNILDFRNIGRIFTGNVYVVDESKNFYNITPRCD